MSDTQSNAQAVSMAKPILRAPAPPGHPGLRPLMRGTASLNPAGRPSTKPIREALQKFYEDPANRTRLEEVIQALHRHAISNKRTLAAHAQDFIRDVLDGPLEHRIAGPDGGALPVQVILELKDRRARHAVSPARQETIDVEMVPEVNGGEACPGGLPIASSDQLEASQLLDQEED